MRTPVFLLDVAATLVVRNRSVKGKLGRSLDGRTSLGAGRIVRNPIVFDRLQEIPVFIDNAVRNGGHCRRTRTIANGHSLSLHKRVVPKIRRSVRRTIL